jgi:glutathione S-transferase
VFWGLIRTAPEKRDMTAISTAVERLGQAMTILDGHLAGHSFVAGEVLTMGDIPVGVAAWRYFNFDIARPELPHLDAWYQRLRAREAYRTHVMLPLT